jgi:hypothetical protein
MFGTVALMYLGVHVLAAVLAAIHGLVLGVSAHLHSGMVRGLRWRGGWLSGGERRSGDQHHHVISPEFEL